MRTIHVTSGLLAFALIGASATAIAQYRAEVPPDDPAANKTHISNDTLAPEWTETDSNRDGFLSKEELIPFPSILKKFEQIDTNGDGMISQGEYADYLAGKHRDQTR